MLRVVIWIGRSGKGFGPIGLMVSVACTFASGYMLAKQLEKKDVKQI